MDVKSILLDVGYSNIKDNGRELRMRPIYRDSGNDSVLSVRKDTGHFIDFSKSVSGSFEYLIQLSLGLKSVDEAKRHLQDKWSITTIERDHRPTVESLKIFPQTYLTKLIPNHKYWKDRGVAKETIETFEGGVVENGTMANRYVFPIFNSRRDLIGLTGRVINEPQNKKTPKWLHKGKTSEWKYPLQYNYNSIKEKKEIFLIESIGDMLAMWGGGVKNTLIVFGVNLSPSIMSLLIKLNLNKIFISFNNDSYNNNAGNKAAVKAKKKLSKHFDPEDVEIHLPKKNDFGEMSPEEIQEWMISNFAKK
jgi:DNA primase